MEILDNQRVVAIEEHYYDPDVIAHYTGVDARTGGFVKVAGFPSRCGRGGSLLRRAN